MLSLPHPKFSLRLRSEEWETVLEFLGSSKSHGPSSESKSRGTIHPLPSPGQTPAVLTTAAHLVLEGIHGTTEKSQNCSLESLPGKKVQPFILNTDQSVKEQNRLLVGLLCEDCTWYWIHTQDPSPTIKHSIYSI